MAGMLIGLLAELLFGDIGVAIPTYVGNDNSDDVYQVDSSNTVTNEKRLNGFLESNMEYWEENRWLSVWYIPGDINTSEGLTKSLYIANIRNLLACNTFRIVTGVGEGNREKDSII